MADEAATYSELLPPVTSSVAAARRFVVAAARSWGVTVLANDLALVVSELVTNAIEHGAGPVGLAARRWGDGVQIEVSSALTSQRPARLDPSPMMETGRGLLVVDALASDWGHRESRLQRTVWARLTGALPTSIREED
jgi:anti-sigma regulatory factor (Ser/Thr protein kinase)